MPACNIVSCSIQERNKLIEKQYDIDREKLQKIRLLLVTSPSGNMQICITDLFSSKTLVMALETRNSPTFDNVIMYFKVSASLHL